MGTNALTTRGSTNYDETTEALIEKVNYAHGYNYIRTCALLIVVSLNPSFVFGQSYTISPTPFQTALDNNGTIINQACVWTYAAGTTTPATTYSDNAGTPNLNPIRSDPAGRFTAYLVSGTSYKFIYETACTPPAHGTSLRTADNIAGVPASAAAVDYTVTAGEALSAGNCAYISDGSGGKTNGQAYKCDSTNTYSSSLAGVVGIVPSAIASGSSGTMRAHGSVTGLSSLSPGSKYYVSTSGAITTTAPANVRFVGTADTATSILLEPESLPLAAATGLVLTSSGTTTRPTFQGYMNSVCDGRLTLTTATPVTTADVTGATNVFWTPYRGNKIALYDGSATWQVLSFSEVTQALGTLTNALPYDVFAFNNSGAVSTEILAWTSATARATALVLQDGVLVKSGATTRRYLGSFFTTSTTTTEDSVLKRDLFNYYNRADRELLRLETNASWTYNSATLHQANGSASNQVEFMIGFSEDTVDVSVEVSANYPTASNAPLVGLGLDSTSTVAGNQVLATTFNVANTGGRIGSRYVGLPGIGKHFLSWNEAVVNSGTAVTFVSNTNSIGGLTTGSSLQSGIVGRIRA